MNNSNDFFTMSLNTGNTDAPTILPDCRSPGGSTLESPRRRKVINKETFEKTLRKHLDPQVVNELLNGPRIHQPRARGWVRSHVQTQRGLTRAQVQAQPLTSYRVERNPLNLRNRQKTWAGVQHNTYPERTQEAAYAQPRWRSDKVEQQRDPTSYSDYKEWTRTQPEEQAQHEQLGARFRERQEMTRMEARNRADREREDAVGFEDDDTFIPNIKD
ncbi:hypothetical protein F4782DRAFT_546265 [Xylaria castorea]|nr:hypothetical protein F4782DRAFT_546265 [Xylaria castorea]